MKNLPILHSQPKTTKLSEKRKCHSKNNHLGLHNPAKPIREQINTIIYVVKSVAIKNYKLALVEQLSNFPNRFLHAL